MGDQPRVLNSQAVESPLAVSLKRRVTASKRTTHFWLEQARNDSMRLIKARAMAATKADEEAQAQRKSQTSIKKSRGGAKSNRGATKGDAIVSPSTKPRASLVSAGPMRDQYLHSEGESNWRAIENCGDGDGTRFIEFYLPPERRTLAANQERAARRRKNMRSPNSEEHKEKARPILAHELDKKRRQRACGLCEMSFDASTLRQSVTRASITRLRKSWAEGISQRNKPVQGMKLLIDPQTRPVRVPPAPTPTKYKYARLYDRVRVCLFCSQFFESLVKDDRARPPEAPSRATPRQRGDNPLKAPELRAGPWHLALQRKRSNCGVCNTSVIVTVSSIPESPWERPELPKSTIERSPRIAENGLHAVLFNPQRVSNNIVGRAVLRPPTIPPTIVAKARRFEGHASRKLTAVL